LRAQLRTAVAPDGDEGDAPDRALRGGEEQLRQPLVDQPAVCRAPSRPGEPVVGEQGAALEGHPPERRTGSPGGEPPLQSRNTMYTAPTQPGDGCETSPPYGRRHDQTTPATVEGPRHPPDDRRDPRRED